MSEDRGRSPKRRSSFSGGRSASISRRPATRSLSRARASAVVGSTPSVPTSRSSEQDIDSPDYLGVSTFSLSGSPSGGESEQATVESPAQATLRELEEQEAQINRDLRSDSGSESGSANGSAASTSAVMTTGKTDFLDSFQATSRNEDELDQGYIIISEQDRGENKDKAKVRSLFLDQITEGTFTLADKDAVGDICGPVLQVDENSRMFKKALQRFDMSKYFEIPKVDGEWTDRTSPPTWKKDGAGNTIKYNLLSVEEQGKLTLEDVYVFTEFVRRFISPKREHGIALIGALSDAGILSRRNILLLSFLGSALSYALIVIGGFRNLIVSRVIVGLVKQTMTVSTSILARITTAENRAVNMGRLTSASTVAWIVGPSAGALLYKNVDASAPALAACGLFLINSLLAAVLIPNDHGDGTTATSPSSDSKARQCSNQSEKCAKGGKFSSFSKNLRACFSSSMLAPVVIGLLLFGWVTRATSYANMASFYEEKYGIETHQRGYLKSYQQILNFVFQSFFVRAFLSAAGGERKAACIASFVLAAATLVELRASFAIFVCVVCPAVTVAVGMIGLSLKSILTQVAPKESLGSVLAALDVLTNAASVSVPFYRTGLFSVLSRIAGAEDEEASMRGDPDPNLWLLSSFCHWTLFAIVVSCLLMLPRFSIERKTPKKKKA